MKNDKKTTFGDIHDYLRRVNGEPEDLDFKSFFEQSRALMAQKNEAQASEGQLLTQHQRNRNVQVSLLLRRLQHPSL